MEGRVASFFQECADAEDKRAVPLESLASERAANRDNLAGFDKALRGSLGVGITDFIAAKFLEPLTHEFERRFVAAADLDEPLRQDLHGRTHRSYVHKLGTADRELEACWTGPRRILMDTLDMGTVGWGRSAMMFHGTLLKGFRGARFADVHHRHQNNSEDSLSASGLRMIRAEAVIASNNAHAPWGSAANFSTLQSSAKELLRTFDTGHDTFTAMYPFICHDRWSGKVPRCVDEEDTKFEVWRWCSDYIMTSKVGSHVKLNRFWQVWSKTKLVLPTWSCSAFFHLHLCLTRGYYTSYKNLAIFGGGAGRAEGQLGAVAPGEIPAVAKQPTGRDVKRSSQHLEALRGKCKSQQHMATEVLTSRSTRGVLVLLTAVTEVMEVVHGVEATNLKTAMGRHNWNVDHACGMGNDYIYEAFRRLCSEDVMVNAGCLPWSWDRLDTVLDLSTSREVMRSALVYWQNLVRREVLWCMRWTRIMPGLAFSQLSPSEEKRTTGMERMRALWDALAKWEPHSGLKTAIREWIRDLEYPVSQWPREILLASAESSWKQLPDDIMQEVRDSSYVCGTTLLNELLNNFCRAQEEASRNKRNSAMNVMHSRIHSGVLEDFEMNGVAPLPEDEIAAQQRTLPKGIFRSDVGKEFFSPGQKVLDEYDTDTVPYMSADRWLQIPLAAHCLEHCSTVAEFTAAYLSLLAVEGTCLWRPAVAPSKTKKGRTASPWAFLRSLRVLRLGALLAWGIHQHWSQMLPRVGQRWIQFVRACLHH